MFKPQLPYTTPIELLIPTYVTKKGVTTKTFPTEGKRLNCSFKTYGGTEITNNGVYTIEDTANVEMWYTPDLTSECRIKVLSTGITYEVIGAVENVEMRNQFAKFKVKSVRGGA